MMQYLWMLAKSESPVENGGKHPMIYRLPIILLVYRISLAQRISSISSSKGSSSP
jgi:hypothetical protein